MHGNYGVNTADAPIDIRKNLEEEGEEEIN
jgi:hypothetical protein